MCDLSRIMRPASLAVVGGGAWCAAVLAQLRKFGFPGPVWHVHPRQGELRRVADLPAPPDAVFIGVNRHQTVGIVAELSAMGAGGAVCLASGFSEAGAEDGDAAALQAELVAAAGAMPILGPNCYGFVNALDGVCLWPDQHGLLRCDRGVAILTQSSNIGINITMAARGLPVAALVCVGNQAQTGMAEIGRWLIADDRITALGLHVEGISDLRAWEALSQEARARGKRIVVLKPGRSAEARAATVSHTGSLAGADAGAAALLARLGMARVEGVPALLETLKLLHVGGPLASRRIATISCSGGEASLCADSALRHGLTFPPLQDGQRDGLRAVLGPMVALANPLDYHTYIWRDVTAMTRAFSAMVDPGLAITLLVADFPRADRCDPGDWDCVVAAAIATRQATGRPLGLVATLPETLPEALAERLAAAGVVPFLGLDDAFAAIAAASVPMPGRAAPVVLPGSGRGDVGALSEAEAKRVLAGHGLAVPAGQRLAGGADPAQIDLRYPVALKGEGAAHKTEAGLVRLGLSSAAELTAATRTMDARAYLVEEMVTDGVAELLIGVLRDPAHGFVLTLAAGGVLAELLDDRENLLVPATPAAVRAALGRLRCAALLRGYRGARGADIEAVLTAVMAVQDYVTATAGTLEEVEINPLICTPDRAVAVDALIRKADA